MLEKNCLILPQKLIEINDLFLIVAFSISVLFLSELMVRWPAINLSEFLKGIFLKLSYVRADS